MKDRGTIRSGGAGTLFPSKPCPKDPSGSGWGRRGHWVRGQTLQGWAPLLGKLRSLSLSLMARRAKQDQSGKLPLGDSWCKA